MFAALAPLVKERSIHVLISAGADNRLAIYVEPMVKDKENGAFGSPFRCEASPDELDAQFATVIAKWLSTRSNALKSLSDALAEAEAATKKAAEDSKKKIADAKAKQTAAKTPVKTSLVKPAAPATPSLLDSIQDDDDEDDEEGGCATLTANSEAIAPPLAAPAAAVEAVVAPATVEPVVAPAPVVQVVAPPVTEPSPLPPAATITSAAVSHETIDLF